MIARNKIGRGQVMIVLSAQNSLLNREKTVQIGALTVILRTIGPSGPPGASCWTSRKAGRTGAGQGRTGPRRPDRRIARPDRYVARRKPVPAPPAADARRRDPAPRPTDRPL